MLYSIECECAGEPLNAGQPGCMPIAGRDITPIFMHYKDSTGALNGIPSGTVIDQAFLDAKLNNTDETERWWMMPEMHNLSEPVAVNETEDIDGIPVPTGEETKAPITYEHTKEDANPALKAAYDSLKCRDLGVIFITRFGQLNGMNDGFQNLVSIHLQGGTMSAQYAAPTKGVNQKLMVSFLIDEFEDEANRDYIASGSISYPTSNWFLRQPKEVIFTEISQSGQDTIVFDLHGLYGGVTKKSPIEGFVTAEFVSADDAAASNVYNKTDDANVGVTIVESSTIPGRYTATLAAPQDDDDVVQFAILKTGYHMRVASVTILAS